MEKENILNILNRIEWLIERNRFVEARRLVEREMNNLKGTTEQLCKLYKLNKDFCQVCKNLNCNLNKYICK